MDSKTSERISTISFLMTCMIVMYHAGSTLSAINAYDTFLNDFINNSAEQLARFAMSFFFMTTGFLLFRDLNFQNYTTKIKKRVTSLLIPYIIWQIIGVPFSIKTGQPWTMSSFIKKCFLFDAWPADGPLWYVYVVFILAVLSPFLLILFKNKMVGLIAILVIFYVTNGSIGQFVGSYGYVGNIIWYLPSYLFGSYWGHFHSDSMDDLNGLKDFAFIILVAFLGDCIKGGTLMEIFLRILPLIALYFFPTFNVFKNQKVIKVMNISFLIYALHRPLMIYTQPHAYNIISEITDYAFINNILGRILTAIMIITIAYIFSLLLNKFAPKILSLLTGGRAH